MSKHVTFDPQVQQHQMSVDQETHRQEVQDPVGAGIPMISPPTPVEPAEVSGIMGVSWWWIVLAVIVAVIVGYFVWRYFSQKKDKPTE